MQNEWKYIQMACQKGSFSRAAQALFLTQPALSLAIQRVENEIGMPRTRKPLVLTEAGRIRIEKMNTGSIRAGATISRIPCGTGDNGEHHRGGSLRTEGNAPGQASLYFRLRESPVCGPLRTFPLFCWRRNRDRRGLPQTQKAAVRPGPGDGQARCVVENGDAL